MTFSHPIALFALVLLSLAFGFFIGAQWPRRSKSKSDQNSRRGDKNGCV